MKYRAYVKPLRLFTDAMTGLALFLLMAGLLTGTCDGKAQLSDIYMGQANARALAIEETLVQPTAQSPPLAMVRTYPGQVFRSTGRTTAFLVLGGVFTLLFVGNLALYRHLRAQYSRPRGRT